MPPTVKTNGRCSSVKVQLNCSENTNAVMAKAPNDPSNSNKKSSAVAVKERLLWLKSSSSLYVGSLLGGAVSLYIDIL